MGTGVSATYGGPGALSAAQFGTMQSPLLRWGHVEGCEVTPGAGVREVDIAAGTVWTPGAYHVVTETTLTLPENASGQPRRDSIILEYDWNADGGNGDAQLTDVQGSPAASPSAPALTRNAGTVFQVELAEVHVAAGAGVLPAAWDTRRPGQWRALNAASPWSDYGGAFVDLAWRIRHDGDVELRGLVQTASTITSPASQDITTIPDRYRPAARTLFVVTAREGSYSSAETARVDVDNDGGQVLVYRPANTTGTRWYSLAGIRWTPAEMED